jgi:hypothetical protein
MVRVMDATKEQPEDLPLDDFIERCKSIFWTAA